MFNKKISERGFMMMNVIFLTLIVSFTALIFLNGARRVNETDSALRLTALNLANEQFAEIEHLAAENNLSTGSHSFLGDENNLKNFGLYKDEDLQNKKPAEFTVTTSVENYSDNLKNVKITVKCTHAEKNFEIELEKLVRIGG